jgi:hypothetical protein
VHDDVSRLFCVLLLRSYNCFFCLLFPPQLSIMILEWILQPLQQQQQLKQTALSVLNLSHVASDLNFKEDIHRYLVIS